MAITSIGNLKFSGSVAPKAAITPEQEQQANTMIANLRSNYTQLENAKDLYASLSLEDQSAIEAMKARITAEIELLEVFKVTGQWTGVGDAGSLLQNLPDLNAGWNGKGIEYVDVNDPEYKKYQANLRPGDGILDKVINVPASSGTSASAAIGFAVKDTDNIKKITGRTVGEDIWITITYNDGTVKTSVLKGLAIRSDQIFISAAGCNKNIILDFSKVIRMKKDSNGKFSSSNSGVILVGGNGSDILIGSQSNDMIYGGKGNDTLLGMAGKDSIYGDEVTKNSESDAPVSINEYGGNDYIDGGVDADTIFGGGGGGDKAVADAADTINEVENPNISLSAQMDRSAATDSMITATGWTHERDEASGEIVITREPNSTVADDSITIDAPEGYTLATAENDASDIIITFVKIDSDGLPAYIKVRIKGVTAGGNQTTINVNGADEGSIIDFSKCRSGSNRVVINGKDGDDAILGPITNLDEKRIKASDLTSGGSTLGIDKLRSILTSNTPPVAAGQPPAPCNWGGVTWTSTGVENGEIVLEGSLTNQSLDFKTTNLAGFGSVDGAYYKDEGNDRILYLVHINESTGAIDVIKVRIKDGAVPGAINSILVGSSQVAQAFGEASIGGGAGENLLIGSLGTLWDTAVGEDHTLEGWYTEQTARRPSVSAMPEEERDEEAVYGGQPVLGADGSSHLKWGDLSLAYPTRTVWEVVYVDHNNPNITTTP